MQTRLFHTIVIVGASLGAAATSSVAVGCSGSDETSTTGDGGKTDGMATDGSKDTFPGISPGEGGVFDTGKVDSSKGDATDADATDTFPTIAIDSGTDTFPGISPAADTFPGISPPPAPSEDTGAG